MTTKKKAGGSAKIRLGPTPAEREQARRAFEAAKPEGERAARYTTDDRDQPQRNVLEIVRGGNGDWYVSVAPEGEGTAGRGVHICTSGGAQQHAPGLANAIAAAYRAICEGDGEMSLHRRIAAALGWTVENAQSFSLSALRELVRPVDAALAEEITRSIATDEHLKVEEGDGE